MNLVDNIVTVVIAILLLLLWGSLMYSVFGKESVYSSEDTFNDELYYGTRCKTCHREWVDKTEYLKMAKGVSVNCGECQSKETDIHTVNAARLFRKPNPLVTPEERQLAKKLAYAHLHGTPRAELLLEFAIEMVELLESDEFIKLN